MHWQPTGGANQHWTFIPLPDGNDEIANAYSGLLFDDMNASTSNGTLIEAWSYWGGVNQQWSISPFANPMSSLRHRLERGAAPRARHHLTVHLTGLASLSNDSEPSGVIHSTTGSTQPGRPGGAASRHSWMTIRLMRSAAL